MMQLTQKNVEQEIKSGLISKVIPILLLNGGRNNNPHQFNQQPQRNPVGIEAASPEYQLRANVCIG